MTMEPYLFTRDLAVGYGGKALLQGIDLQLRPGRLHCLIGPNGAGKSTILKTLTRQLVPVGGGVYIQNRSLSQWPRRQLAARMAVVLTHRARPELLTCAEVVAMGRYPYTGLLGRLSAADKAAVLRALEQVHAADLAGQDFSTLSDGQRQRVLLARALCQQPELLVLDEPTAYLDIRHKLDLLDILRRLAREENLTVLLSLHEIDLAVKVSDWLFCVKGDSIAASGPPEAILRQGTIEALYDMDKGSYNLAFGSVELPRPAGKPQVFVVAGGGSGIPCFRALQKRQLPFAAGILFENDIDFQVARQLAGQVVSAPAFEPISPALYRQAARLLLDCGRVLDAGTPAGSLNQPNRRLLELAARRGISVEPFSLP